MKQYAKAIVTFVGAVGTWIGTALADGSIDKAEWGLLAAALATTYLVYQVRNEAPAEGGADGFALIELCWLVIAVCVIVATAHYVGAHC